MPPTSTPRGSGGSSGILDPPHAVPDQSNSWLNMLEHFFGELTTKRIRRGVFQSVTELIEAIEKYHRHHNAAPTPFVWTATVETIMEKIARVRKDLIRPGQRETLHWFRGFSNKDWSKFRERDHTDKDYLTRSNNSLN